MKYDRIKHLLPLMILALAALVVYLLGLHRHLTFADLKKEEAVLRIWIAEHPFLFAVLLSCTYIASICLLIPSATVLTLFAATVYPFPYAFALSVVSETIGALLLFLTLRLAFLPRKIKKKKAYLDRAEENFQKNPACYLLFLRFSHFTPSSLITVLSAFFKAPVWTFVWTTFLGTLPVSYLVVDAAKTIRQHLGSGIDDFTGTDTQLILLALGVLSLLPILCKKFIKR